ncbi:hypothetical protein HK104_006654, partial [Borealophlyctis nickersoniae]
MSQNTSFEHDPTLVACETVSNVTESESEEEPEMWGDSTMFGFASGAHQEETNCGGGVHQYIRDAPFDEKSVLMYAPYPTTTAHHHHSYMLAPAPEDCTIPRPISRPRNPHQN